MCYRKRKNRRKNKRTHQQQRCYEKYSAVAHIFQLKNECAHTADNATLYGDMQTINTKHSFQSAYSGSRNANHVNEVDCV